MVSLYSIQRYNIPLRNPNCINICLTFNRSDFCAETLGSYRAARLEVSSRCAPWKLSLRWKLKEWLPLFLLAQSPNFLNFQRSDNYLNFSAKTCSDFCAEMSSKYYRATIEWKT